MSDLVIKVVILTLNKKLVLCSFRSSAEVSALLSLSKHSQLQDFWFDPELSLLSVWTDVFSSCLQVC